MATNCRKREEPRSHSYHMTKPCAKNNFAKAAKSAVIERHPLLETPSHNDPLRSGTPRYGAPDAPLVDFSLSSAQVAVTRGPLSKVSVCGSPAPNSAGAAKKTVNPV